MEVPDAVRAGTEVALNCDYDLQVHFYFILLFLIKVEFNFFYLIQFCSQLWFRLTGTFSPRYSPWCVTNVMCPADPIIRWLSLLLFSGSDTFDCKVVQGDPWVLQVVATSFDTKEEKWTSQHSPSLPSSMPSFSTLNIYHLCTRYHPGNYPDEKKYFALPRLFLNVSVGCEKEKPLLLEGLGVTWEILLKDGFDLPIYQCDWCVEFDWSSSQKQSCDDDTVVLRDVHADMSGYYTCEVSQKSLKLRGRTSSYWSKCLKNRELRNELLNQIGIVSTGDHSWSVWDGSGKAIPSCCT